MTPGSISRVESDREVENRMARWTLLLTLLAAASGCVDRLLQIRSDPPGAKVFVNGEEIGETPLDYAFDHYGSYGIVFRKFDYRSLKITEEVDAPWFEYFPFDFFSENLVPWVIRDLHRITGTLAPKIMNYGFGSSP